MDPEFLQKLSHELNERAKILRARVDQIQSPDLAFTLGCASLLLANISIAISRAMMESQDKGVED